MSQPADAARRRRRMGWFALALLIPLVAIALPYWTGVGERRSSRVAPPERNTRSPECERVLAILRVARADPALSRSASADEIVRLGPRAASVAIELLAFGRLPAQPGKRAEPIDQRQREILMEALGQLEPARLFEHLRHRVLVERSPEHVASALTWFERYADRDHLQRLFQVAMVRERGQVVSGDVSRALRGALDAILRRDRRAMPALLRTWRWADIELLPTIARSVGTSGDPRGLEVLCEMLGSNSDVDGLLMAQISRLAPAAVPPYPERLLDALRERLAADAEGLRKGAAIALGKLGETGALPEIFELLEADAPAVREDARWALEQITGMPLPPHGECWKQWYRAETQWHESEASAALAGLRGPEAAAVAALRTIAQHPLYRHELAEATCDALEHPSPAVRALACESLEQLGSWVAADGLVAALDDLDDGVSTAAHRALQKLTGWDHPPEAEVWDRAIREIRHDS